MKASAWISRWLLILTYSLTLVLVDGGHRHGTQAADTAECSTACAAPGPHLSGHTSPDLSDLRHDCPACQHRSLTLASPLADAPVFRTRSEPLVRAERLTRSQRFASGLGSRAPPRV